MSQQPLPFGQFMAVVEHAPLVSIDLLVFNPQGQVLLGWRNNRPASGHWFVPGGRVLKDERLDDAFMRLTNVELGIAFPRQLAQWQGVYEHFYSDNAGDMPGFGTHYVVLAYRLQLDETQLAALPLGQQHARYCWLTPAEAAQHPQVHQHSRDYFVSAN
ncbi:MAG: GDP-mannose mannosyl hydrolase [Vogesella sp.]|uniref:GDP-mannose mannosyl hydrolase n=1 Tax=Vogesella sp. TaxID=1904252 RepID=UPI00391D9178